MRTHFYLCSHTCLIARPFEFGTKTFRLKT